MAPRTALAREPSHKPNKREVNAWKNKYKENLNTLRTSDPGSPEYDAALKNTQKWGKKANVSGWQNAVKIAQNLTPEQRWNYLSPEKQASKMAAQSGFNWQQMQNQFQGFDPNKPFAGYEMGFGEARDKAYNDVMAQFNRSMEPEFQRQNAEFQQRMADQGLDPSSGAYQAQYKAMADAQNNARLNAQSQASQQAYQVQQQAFNQGQEAQMLPAQFWQATNQPWLLPTEQRGNINLANVQGGWQMKQQQAQTAAQERIAALNARTQTGISQAEIASREEIARQQLLNQYPDKNKPKKPGFTEGLKQTTPIGIGQGGMS